jgi:energy-coupling factor transport system permease protein
MFHTKAWVLWLVAMLLPCLLTRNPLYLILAVLVATLDFLALARSTPSGKQWGLLLRLSVGLAMFSVLFNLLFVSFGATRLLVLPALRLNLGGVAMQIGGAVTAESLVYGISQALSLIGILVAFATFNALADHYELLRSTPRFLYQSAIVLSIAVTFVPQMMVAQAEIREAQALRGHRFRGVRDLPPLFIALLAEGLERSITLAESMSARGFGSRVGGGGARTGLALQGIIAFGLFLLGCGVFALTYVADKTYGALLLAVGTGMLAAVLWSIGQGVQRSRYRRGLWQSRDTLLAVASLLSAAVFLGLWLAYRSALGYYPYPRLSWPPFELPVAAAILLLAAPALLGPTPKVPDHD